MNQPPTPLGLQETLAESIYITRPLLHRILPFSERAPAAGGASRGCCGLGPVQGSAWPAPLPALLCLGTALGTLPFLTIWCLASVTTALFSGAPSTALGCVFACTWQNFADMQGIASLCASC